MIPRLIRAQRVAVTIGTDESPLEQEIKMYDPRAIAAHYKQELAKSEAALTAHMASWEYAFAMGSVCCGSEHPRSWATRTETDRLVMRTRTLKALVAEHDPDVVGKRAGDMADTR